MNMLRHNIGRLDRTLRIIAGAALAPIALIALGARHGNLSGILVAALAVMLLVTGFTGFCPAYVPFGVSTTGRARAGQAGQ
jgi:hypothetical protein